MIDQLAADLSLAFPDSKGFSRRNLHYMRRLAEAWPAPTFVQQPAAQMPWGHLMVVLDKIEEPAARDWYVHQCVAGGWSRNVLLNQIKGRAHARAGAAPSNFELTLPEGDSELAAQIAKDPYVFDFLRFSWRVAERDLETALVGRLPDTLLELDTGFAVRRAPGSPHISADQGTRHRPGPGGDHPAGLGRGRGRSRAVPRGVRPDAPRPGRADPQPRKHGSA